MKKILSKIAINNCGECDHHNSSRKDFLCNTDPTTFHEDCPLSDVEVIDDWIVNGIGVNGRNIVLNPRMNYSEIDHILVVKKKKEGVL